MYLGVGVSLLSAAVLLFAWAYAAHRWPVPARWTQREFLSSGICIVITGLFPVGLGCIFAAFLDPAASMRSLGPASLALILVSLAVGWLGTRRLWRSASAASAQASLSPAGRIAPRPGSGTPRAARGKRSKARAA
jgi:hypothetical protein